MSFILRFFILKGSLSKSNTVSRSVRQLQSPALWSGPSILSPTSWLFKRAKAQQCSFLNTQIHPSTNRGTAVWQKSLSFSLTLSHSPALPLSHLGLWHPLLSLPILLHRPHYTRILLSLSLHPSVSHLTGQLPHFTIHLPLLLLYSLYLSVIVLSIPLPSFTFFFYPQLLQLSSLFTWHSILMSCLLSIFAAAQSLSPPLTYTPISMLPFLIPHTQQHHTKSRWDAITLERELKWKVAIEGLVNKPCPPMSEWRLASRAPWWGARIGTLECSL